jgi:NAD(P)-dependent dehydrogenase (short-subunit alcohol dehydrogenase family)|tara:strand:+ start:2498 stop:3244 length:747 start_codon:yes stop_codon:yes gene_type:complete
MKIDLNNKKVIVTGGSTGIGKEVVKLFAKNNAKVAIFDVNNTEGIELTNELNQNGHEIRYWNVDVRDANQVSGGVIAAAQWLEGIDILINLAGILQGASLEIDEFPDEIWDSVVGINLTGSFLMAKHVSNIMKKQKSGVIILTSSGAGVDGSSSSFAYGSSKGGVHGFSMVLMDKLSKYGIRVHDILPGSVDTPLKNSQIETSRDITGNEAEYKNIKNILVEPEGIAKIILFMCSDDASLLKGSIRTK